MTKTVQILKELKEFDGTPSELATALGFGQNNVRSLLSNLKRTGCVEAIKKTYNGTLYRFVKMPRVTGRPRDI